MRVLAEWYVAKSGSALRRSAIVQLDFKCVELRVETGKEEDAILPLVADVVSNRLGEKPNQRSADRNAGEEVARLGPIGPSRDARHGGHEGAAIGAERRIAHQQMHGLRLLVSRRGEEHCGQPIARRQRALHPVTLHWSLLLKRM